MAALLPRMIFAQTDTGAITGVVSDATGAVIQHAEVTAINQATHITLSVTTTNDKGFYFVPDLRPGVYSVSAVLQGFKASEQSGISLQVGQTTRIDFRLEIGDAQEKVTVTTSAPALDTRLRIAAP